MNELHVVATIPVKPEDADSVRRTLADLVTATREEEGCLSYDLYESTATPGVFVTVERWKDQTALDAHMGAPHVAAALGEAAGSLVGDLVIHPLDVVEIA